MNSKFMNDILPKLFLIASESPHAHAYKQLEHRKNALVLVSMISQLLDSGARTEKGEPFVVFSYFTMFIILSSLLLPFKSYSERSLMPLTRNSTLRLHSSRLSN
jgi:hypothetical protein